MKLAASLETAEQRLMAYDLVAIAIRDGQRGSEDHAGRVS